MAPVMVVPLDLFLIKTKLGLAGRKVQRKKQPSLVSALGFLTTHQPQSPVDYLLREKFCDT